MSVTVTSTPYDVSVSDDGSLVTVAATGPAGPSGASFIPEADSGTGTSVSSTLSVVGGTNITTSVERLDDAAVIRPCWSTVNFPTAYSAGVTAVFASEIVPLDVTGPPDRPVPVSTCVTVPPPLAFTVTVVPSTDVEMFVPPVIVSVLVTDEPLPLSAAGENDAPLGPAGPVAATVTRDPSSLTETSYGVEVTVTLIALPPA